MKTKTMLALALLAAVCSFAAAQEERQPGEASFAEAGASLQQELQAGLAELDRLRERIAQEQIPQSRKLSDLESELIKVRYDFQQATRTLDSRTLDLSNLRSEIQSRTEEAAYLANLFGEYIRNFESRLHIAELQRYEAPLEEVKLAPENSNLTEQEVYQAQAALLDRSIERLFEALGGAAFEGTAVDGNGLVNRGKFVMIGPAALFRSLDGGIVGTAEQRLGSLEPTVIAFADPEDAAGATQVVANGGGLFPLDPTLGNAHKIEETHESLWEHIQKGGPVMVPIFVLAAAMLIVAVLKWIGMAFIRKPSRQQLDELVEAVKSRDEAAVRQKAGAIKGPVGQMLSAGAKHVREPRDLIEEIMYEKVLATRIKLQRFLSFIAISAASAPLLGLLGTVTGIISTFKLITVFGSGDVKMLSGGISEALITTEFGLIVAIPSLLIHAFLSRKARGVVNQMETAAIAFINQIVKTPFHQPSGANRERDSGDSRIPDPQFMKMMVKTILEDELARVHPPQPAPET